MYFLFLFCSLKGNLNLISFYSLSLQDSMSSLMVHISTFHDHVMMVMLMVISCVFYVFMMIVAFPCYGRFMKSSEMLEGIWTILPCLILASLAAPSLTTLYISDEISNPVSSIKIIGHQWFWSYEYDDGSLSYDSYMIPSSSLNIGENRLLEVDKSMFVPMGSEVRMIVSSEDVIHSWSVPSVGVKMDAIPGRLNQFYMKPFRFGIMYGQCSEICGSLHSFMPIKVEIIKFDHFLELVQ
nr:cytochrome c oxidase subunit 2 [Megaginus tataupensis]